MNRDYGNLIIVASVLLPAARLCFNTGYQHINTGSKYTQISNPSTLEGLLKSYRQ